jgi:putative membrane protein
MKSINLVITAVALSASVLQACNNSNTKNDSKANADSANAKKDTSSMGSTLAVNKDDAQFAVDAASGGMAEVELGKLAQSKATNPQVKEFAQKMVTDHTKANNELMDVAKLKNITLPSVPGADEQKVLADLTKKSGKDFDKAYVSAMVDDHKKDVKEFDGATKSVKDTDIKAFAVKTLPTLKMHLDMINKIHDSLK